MEEVRVAEKRLSDYRAIIGGPAFAEILALASKLKGKRVAHVNATGYGGGVAELLHSLVPLQRDVGLDVHWFVLDGSNAFFTATKTMHNALQGSDVGLTPDMEATYRHFNELNAASFQDEYDYVIIHDPQPAPFATLCERKGHWIWRCHIDLTSEPVRPAAPRASPGSLRCRRLQRPRVRPADRPVPADLRESARDRSDEPEEPPCVPGGVGDHLASVRRRFRPTRDQSGRPLRSMEGSAQRHRCVSTREEEDSEGTAVARRLDGPRRSGRLALVRAL